MRIVGKNQQPQLGGNAVLPTSWPYHNSVSTTFEPSPIPQHNHASRTQKSLLYLPCFRVLVTAQKNNVSPALNSRKKRTPGLIYPGEGAGKTHWSSKINPSGSPEHAWSWHDGRSLRRGSLSYANAKKISWLRSSSIDSEDRTPIVGPGSSTDVALFDLSDDDIELSGNALTPIISLEHAGQCARGTWACISGTFVLQKKALLTFR
ncbi:MAG: hypothetical protein J3Q66DRAFT_116413 [Benniella sp.]|nr:MAG: hypothetical protein J3Q66DRAFT_116413 [Benniella sp.]